MTRAVMKARHRVFRTTQVRVDTRSCSCGGIQGVQERKDPGQELVGEE